MHHLSCQISTTPVYYSLLLQQSPMGLVPTLHLGSCSQLEMIPVPLSTPPFPLDTCFIGGSKMKSSAQIPMAEKPSGGRKGCALSCQTPSLS